MKKVFVRMMLVVLVGSLGACSPSIENGEVVDKTTEEAYSIVVLVPQVIPVGNTTVTNLIPVVQNYPQAYALTVEGRNQAGATTRETIYVPKHEFDQLAIGDAYLANRTHTLERTYTERDVTTEEAKEIK